MRIRILFTILFCYGSVKSGSGNVLFQCIFKDATDMCTLVKDTTVEASWDINIGGTPSRSTGPGQDHTTGSGYYLYAEASGFGSGDRARVLSPTISGTASQCTTITFFAHTYGEDVGALNLYILGDQPYHFVNPVWQRSEISQKGWVEAKLQLLVDFDYSVAFETVFRRGGVTDNRGDIAIDDILIQTNQSCEISSCADEGIACLNGGTCVAMNGASGSDFEYYCECVSGWSGDHCQNDYDECASNPCYNGICGHGVGNFYCDCLVGYYGDLCEFIDACISEELHRCQNGGICNRVENDFNCTCTPGYTGKVCDVNIDECASGPCLNGAQCVDGIDIYTCKCAPGYYGIHCQYTAGDCDFDDGSLNSCGYTNERMYDLDWISNQGKTPIPSFGPSKDHTTGSGYYAYAEVDQFEDDEDERTARLVSPVLLQATVGTCSTISFWYYMYGDNIGTLKVYVKTSSATQGQVLTISGDQGAEWKMATVPISSNVAYSVVFDAISKPVVIAVQNNYIALDDISVTPNSCDFDHCYDQPCKNDGICFSDKDSYVCTCVGTWTGKDCTEDRNECKEPTPVCLNEGICTDKSPGYECACLEDYAGFSCEYLKGSCNFDDAKSPLCGYQDGSTIPGFEWTRKSGPTPSDRTGPSNDHTFGSSAGYYAYVEATDITKFSSARIITPVVPGSGNSCTRLDFWYHMYGRDIGELSLFVQFSTEVPKSPIWTMIGAQGNEWKKAELNISVPHDFKLVFEATVKPQSIIEVDNQGDIAIDDISIHFDSTCTYDKCFVQPCLNRGTCITINNEDYRCDCQPGYEGKNCENTGVCSPNPCLNGGKCSLGSDGKEDCLCPTGWLGDNCEKRDYCFPNPCGNGGTCSSFESSFYCECMPGYDGDKCQINIDDCEGSPCINGGECIDLVDAFECQCSGDYMGETCNEIAGGCNFQSDYCEWKSTSGKYDWVRRSGYGPNYPISGPRVDHTYSNSSGYYIFTEVYKDEPPAGTVYRLSSPIFPKSVIASEKILTLQFFYHMYGPGIGTLNVYYTDGGEENIIEAISKEEDSLDWKKFSKKVEPSSDFSFVIEHKTTGGPFYLADLAVDDITLLIEDRVNVGGTTTKIPTKTTPDDDDDDDDDDGDDDNDDDYDDNELTGGAIAGIVIGVLAVAFLSIGGVLFYRKRRYERFGSEFSSGTEKQVFSIELEADC